MNGLITSRILESKSGSVPLLDRMELRRDWDPATDGRLPVWEVTHTFPTFSSRTARSRQRPCFAERRLGRNGTGVGPPTVRALWDRKKWASEALAYNAPVVARPEIVRLAALAPVRSNDRPFEPDGGL